MSLIANLRGSGGSGKTTSVRTFMAERNPRQLLSAPRTGKTGRPLAPKVLGYELDGRIRVVGSYECTCGGCDTIKDQTEIQDMVEAWADEGFDVIFEGLMVSSTWGRWADFSDRMIAKGHQFIWVFLNTPYEQCLANIYKRNGGKAIKEQLVLNKYQINQSQIKKSEAEERLSFVINRWEDGGEGLAAALAFGHEFMEYQRA